MAFSTIHRSRACFGPGGLSKHAIKQVDRLPSNPGIDTKELFARWVPYIVGARENIEVAMEWTSMPITRQQSCCL